MVGVRRWTALVLVAMAASSCVYLKAAVDAETAGQPVPWWCTATEEIPVTEGPAVGTVDWYAGTHKAPLTWAHCHEMSAQFDLATVVLGAAVAHRGCGRGRRVGADHPVTSPAWAPTTSGAGSRRRCSADPAFDRLNPILDDVGLDAVFDPIRARRPPVRRQRSQRQARRLRLLRAHHHRAAAAGFPGNNDWWHHHPVDLPLARPTPRMIAFNTSDAQLHLDGRRQRQPVELLHAPRLGPRRHEVHPGRVRRHDARASPAARPSTTPPTRATPPATAWRP